ncbi:MAG: hypothetical protein H6936_12800 [Burkholderiales bacterium]|nr:hypothetical protein [Burkholderiales bacterium]
MTFFKVSISSSSLEGIRSLSEVLGAPNLDQAVNSVAANSSPPVPETMDELETGGMHMQQAMDGTTPPLPDFLSQSDSPDSAGSPPPSPDSDTQSSSTIASNAPPVPVMPAEAKKATKKTAQLNRGG